MQNYIVGPGPARSGRPLAVPFLLIISAVSGALVSFTRQDAILSRCPQAITIQQPETANVPRLLLRSNDTLRHFASVNVTHDGSIKLDLVRDGTSENGYQWSFGRDGESPVVERKFAERKTKSITIHTSGRVNYHFGGGQVRYVPCLLDLDLPTPIIGYSIPSPQLLDAIAKPREDDWISDARPQDNRRIAFSFVVLPAALPLQPGELGRFGVEGLYALGWSAHADGTRADLPKKVFTTYQPESGLDKQAVAEEVAYLRFRRAMYANDVIAAVDTLPNRDEVAAEHIEAMIEEGPGLYPPNNEGIWTLLTRVPMRIAPELVIDFEDARYRAEVVELRPGDTRLSTVRVRFKIYDQQAKKYVKGHVAIRGWTLDARL
ncbi:hypothetical protein KDW19_28290 [Burkholderia cenocepacia]|uniref:hypothetical protein n=1 Tax=Burkholderia cepacia complex TaxID=87882 RepID=UPI000F59E1B5|nr:MULTISPECIES: hypothetical protein [Burkholderia cepacia complex]ELW9449471.1 hypothetical protein [Burkholderia cenocepacia]ELW9451688.1 hypothetical protein [Burkholderia cenocepacia]MBR8041229.1 hypothetical protein [Burkholderia cenocepacia]MBR8328916.1 hypothetical protein [Burkholderia cenocepacia]MBR8486369.1 hypothetical protein [Burkholderia cenocepacia]